jgi:hypothetical protein
MKVLLLSLLLAMLSMLCLGQSPAGSNLTGRHVEPGMFPPTHDVSSTVPVMSIISNDTLVLLLDSIIEEYDPAASSGDKNHWQAFRYSQSGKLQDAYVHSGWTSPSSNFSKRRYNYHSGGSVSGISYYQQLIQGYPCMNTYESYFGLAVENEYFIYDNSNLLTEYLLERYGVDFERVFYYYDTLGQLTRIEKRRFDFDTQGLEDYERTLFFYDASGLDTMVYHDIKYPLHSQLIRSTITRKSYDASNRISSEHTYITSLQDTSDFRLRGIRLYEYDQFGNPSAYLNSLINDYGTFTDTSYYVHREYHRCFEAPDSIIVYNGQTFLNEFTDKYRWLYYYSGTTSCFPDSSTYQKWIKDSSDYSIAGPTHYYYDSLNNLIREVWWTLQPTGWAYRGERRHYYRWQNVTPISVEDRDPHFGNPDGLMVYPNPATDRLTVRLLNAAWFETALYDLSGRCVVERAQHATLDLSKLPPGVYLLNVYTHDHVLTRRVVKRQSSY